MDTSVSSVQMAHSDSRCEVLILHTAEADEWASYLQQILKSSPSFRQKSVLLYALSSADRLHGYNFENFQSCKCIVLLVTSVLVEMLRGHELQAALQRLLHPPHRVVLFFCGVCEDELRVDYFRDGSTWRKLYAEDEPSTYVSTISAALTDSGQADVNREAGDADTSAESHFAAGASSEIPDTSNTTKNKFEEQKEALQTDEQTFSPEESPSDETHSQQDFSCITVQPNRLLCGGHEKIFIIFKVKLTDTSEPEVEFSSDAVAPQRRVGTLENEYTISVTAPDMPAGSVTLKLHTGQSCVDLMPVTFYTNMGEVSRLLEKAANPMTFMCQAFNLTSNAAEAVDTVLNDSLKSRMPATGFQLLGVKQIETDNMSANQRDEELPTLLHFAAKYGLKKLTATLLHCPGALQAYSVMNKHGDYPNTLAEKSGFSDLRLFMDEFVETADLLKSHLEDTANSDSEVYEAMSVSSQDMMMMKFSGKSDDVYVSMLGVDLECTEDLYEAMNLSDENPEEVLLRNFFKAKHHVLAEQVSDPGLQSEEEENNEYTSDFVQKEEQEEEDPYHLCPEEIYDTVDTKMTYSCGINRPPVPIPRPDPQSDPEERTAYISKVFSQKEVSRRSSRETEHPGARPVVEAPSSVYDPFAGMKTPGQRQLISLQERVKVGELTVEEAVQEFKSWQFDHERRANSLRYQQENLKKLRDSITRRHKERAKSGREDEYHISHPLQTNTYWGSNLECGVYESTPRMAVLPPRPPPAQTIQRGGWKTDSTSSTSSSDSNRLSTHSTFSSSSGTEPEFEEAVESLGPPPRPPRPSEPLPAVPPPRIPPRTLERVPEEVHERYISCPTRALPQRPVHKESRPPVPRRQR